MSEFENSLYFEESMYFPRVCVALNKESTSTIHRPGGFAKTLYRMSPCIFVSVPAKITCDYQENQKRMTQPLCCQNPRTILSYCTYSANSRFDLYAIWCSNDAYKTSRGGPTALSMICIELRVESRS